MPEAHPMPEDIARVISSLDAAIAPCVDQLRILILDQAKEIPEAGGIEETLKWGQPSYLPRRPRVGTTIRLGPAPGEAKKAALFVHCQTGLVEAYRHLFPELTYAGNRAIIIDPIMPLDEDTLGHCIRMALTYHICKRQRA